MTTPTPAILASTKKSVAKPEPKPRPVKRARGLATHLDPSTVRALRQIAKKGKRR